MCTCVCMPWHTCTSQRTNLWKLVLSFCYVGSRYWTRVIWFGGMHLHLLALCLGARQYIFLCNSAQRRRTVRQHTLECHRLYNVGLGGYGAIALHCYHGRLGLILAQSSFLFLENWGTWYRYLYYLLMFRAILAACLAYYQKQIMSPYLFSATRTQKSDEVSVSA